ncbi:hypothetical protein [Streptomyces sp. NBC_01589]|uniref:hypothetical protein n=1 Tax=unclassified Streptomyces TaxID=2593676 RepID=UPI00386C34CC
MAGTDGSFTPRPVWAQTSGQLALGGAFDTWRAIPGTDLTLPEAGVYQLEADVQGGVSGTGPITNVYVQAHLFDVTAGVEVPMTSRACFVFADTSTEARGLTIHGTATCGAMYEVAGPTVVRVEAMKHIDAGTVGGEVAFCLNFRTRKVSDR